MVTPFKNIEGQLARWMEELSQYDVVIQHRSGRKHVNADSLSRIPDKLESCDRYYAGAELETLPCGGCKYCTRTQTQWQRFGGDVDDIIPLAVRSISQQNIDNIDVNWMYGLTTEVIRKQQEDDHDLKTIIFWLEQEKEPSTFELQLSSKAVKHWWSCREQLKLVNNCLTYVWLDTEGSRTLLLVPKASQSEHLKLCHDNKTVGHPGRDKMFNRLKQRCIWYRMRQDIILYVRSCQDCNLSKLANRKTKSELVQFHAGYPMERVHMDILGPLPTSKAGNKYILSNHGSQNVF
jgi:hypothetical protein